jgi:ribonuclease HI
MEADFETLIVYTDGGSRGNPGPAAVGVVILNKKGHLIKKYSKEIGIKTNNEAEYEAVIFALQKIKRLFGKEKAKEMSIEIRMDSELIVKQLNGQYKIEEERLFPLFIKIWNLKVEIGNILFRGIKREENKEADQLVNDALEAGEQQTLDLK